MNLEKQNGLKLASILKENKSLGENKIVLIADMLVAPRSEVITAAGSDYSMQKPSSANPLKKCFLSLLGEQSTEKKMDASNQCKETTAEKNILVAEDNPVNQIVIRNMLKKLGFRCSIAGDGIMAVKEFEQAENSFDLILMDFEMPNLDGCDAAIRIRELEKFRSLKAIPIVALSAHVTLEHRQLCFEAGMNDHLSKPIDLASLRVKLHFHLK